MLPMMSAEYVAARSGAGLVNAVLAALMTMLPELPELPESPGSDSTQQGHSETSRCDEFVRRVKDRDERALREFFERYSRGVERMLLRVLGPDPDLSDTVQDSFEQALTSLHRFEGNARELGAWMNRIAVNVAKNRLRHRRVRGWLRGTQPYEVSDLVAKVASPEVVDAMRRTYEVLSRLPAQERIMFALRFIDGMQLTEVAETTGVSLATVKRRLVRARKRFDRHARNDPHLAGWFEEACS